MRAIADNRGWLATIYLASGGGNIGTGLIIAEITRMFWLESEAPAQPAFTYWPDFIMRPAVTRGHGEPELTDAVVPPELEEGWKNYVRALVVLRSRPSPAGEGAVRLLYIRACIRSRAARDGFCPSRAALAISCGRQVDAGASRAIAPFENRIIALYRTMDGGEEFVRLFQSTPTATTTPAEAARYPRYISDLLRSKCNADSQQLIERELTLKRQIDDTNGTAGLLPQQIVSRRN